MRLGLELGFPVMATTTKSGSSLNYWRNYFRAANSDIFGLIDHAIMVAAVDCPKEFKLRRDRIAERLFSCRLTRCLGCEKVELVVPGGDDDDDDEVEAGGSKQSKVNSSRDDQLGDMNTSNYSDGLAEALTDEIEEESQIFGEVLRIKEIFQNSEHEVYHYIPSLLLRFCVYQFWVNLKWYGRLFLINLILEL